MKRKITIILLSICILISIIIPTTIYNTPRWNDRVVLTETAFEFRGDKYTFVTAYPSAYDFEKDEFLAHSGGLYLGYDYYSLKNDKNRDFIYVVVFRERYIYSKVGVKQDDIGKSSFKYKDIISPKKSEILYEPNY